MSNKIKCAVALAVFVGGAAQATTLEQLAKKNSELLELKADLEIAKTRSELQKLRPGSSAIGISPNEVVIQPKKLKAEKPFKVSVSAEIDEVEFIGAGGDSANPTGKFIVGNSTILRRQGETINGWLLVKITANEANFTKLDKGETRQKSIYLASVNRLTERRRSVSNSDALNQAPFVPAVAPQQPPIR